MIDRRQTASGQANQVGASRRVGSIVVLLQFLVGGLVTMGVTLFAVFAVNSFGTSLGLVHPSLGLTGLLAGFLTLRGDPSNLRAFLIVVNVVTIAYSSLSESIVQIGELCPASRPSDRWLGL